MKKLLFILLLLVLVTPFLIQCRTTSYINVHTLRARTRNCYRVMPFDVDVYCSGYASYEEPVFAMLREKDLVPVLNESTDQWNVLATSNGNNSGKGMLYDTIKRHRDEIIAWTNNNEDLAKRYWTEGIGRMRSSDRKEVIIGELILLHGWRCANSDELTDVINEIVREQK